MNKPKFETQDMAQENINRIQALFPNCVTEAKDENGNLITDDSGNAKLEPSSISEFSTQLNELLDTSVEINANKINVDLLEDIDFTPTEIALLEPYIDFGEEE